MIIFFTQHTAATEVLQQSSDILENQQSNRPRTESWSQRSEIRQAITAYKQKILNLEDLFQTCEEYWLKMPNLSEGQPFIGDKKTDDNGFIANAPNTRYVYIVEIRLLLKKINSSLDLLTQNVDTEKYDEHFTHLEKVKMETIRTLLYSKVNNPNGMRDYGLTFTKVTKSEWNGENALDRFLGIIGNPAGCQKGMLQIEFETLLSTIDAKTCS